MLQPAFTNQFKKDVRIMEKRGKDIQKLKTTIRTLVEQKQYLLRENEIIFERTGTHSDLFG